MQLPSTWGAGGGLGEGLAGSGGDRAIWAKGWLKLVEGGGGDVSCRWP